MRTPTTTPGPNNTGNATVTGVAAVASAPDETITVQLTSPTAFTVTGSVSGALGSGTVGTAFTSKVISFTVTAGSKASIAGDRFTITD